MKKTLERRIYLKEEKLYQIFKLMDLDGTGKISKDDLKHVNGCMYFIVNY
jgi:calcium-dependent protein kinase